MVVALGIVAVLAALTLAVATSGQMSTATSALSTHSGSAFHVADGAVLHLAKLSAGPRPLCRLCHGDFACGLCVVNLTAILAMHNGDVAVVSMLRAWRV